MQLSRSHRSGRQFEIGLGEAFKALAHSADEVALEAQADGLEEGWRDSSFDDAFLSDNFPQPALCVQSVPYHDFG
jgi:hypothetical protein